MYAFTSIYKYQRRQTESITEGQKQTKREEIQRGSREERDTHIHTHRDRESARARERERDIGQIAAG